MCEMGAWKNFEELEDTLTLDELFLLYEQASERQQRLMKTVAAALGADTSGSSSSDNQTLEYKRGEITDGSGGTIFGYRTKAVEPGEVT